MAVVITAVVSRSFLDGGDNEEQPAAHSPRAATSAEEAEPKLWLSAEEIAKLPTSGRAWDNVKTTAEDDDYGDPSLTERNQHNTSVLAAALVALRLDEDPYRRRVRDELAATMRAPVDDGDVLAACRRLGTYVIAADLAGLEAFDPEFAARFRNWIREELQREYGGGGGGGTIIDVHERRPNNFGTHAGASRIAAALYLDDAGELSRAADVMRGWLGDRTAYADFLYGDDRSWQANPSSPVGMNVTGARIDGHDVDGVLPDDQRRSGPFSWPPERENYVWEALQGAIVSASLLDRYGLPAWEWENQAILRAFRWLHTAHFDGDRPFPAEGDDGWQPWLVNAAYATHFPASSPTTPGKNMGWTDWTHGPVRGAG